MNSKEYKRVTISAGEPYEVLISGGLIPQIGSFVKKIKNPDKIYVITDDNVAALYFEPLRKSLVAAGFSVYEFIMPHGEEAKSISVLSEILEDMAEKEITRSDVIAALGGGVVGDISGFAAAVYLRGIDCFQIPTTFLSAIDSSVGGKTAVNLNHGKNLAGAFKQPFAVFFDVNTLNTLSDEIFADGTAEAIKYGVLRGGGLFETLKAYPRNALMERMEDIAAECISIKGDIVSRDEFDRGERQLLNLGHTIGHGIEKCSGFSVSHGRAVAAGMAIVAKGAVKAGIVPEKGVYKAVCEALQKHKLPVLCDYSAAELYRAMLSDKKRSGKYINLIVPEEIGKCYLKKIPIEKCLEIIEGGLDG